MDAILRMQAKQGDDSGLDSGHNSMNTGSDSASDSNSSEREEPPTITQAARPRRLGETKCFFKLTLT